MTESEFDLLSLLRNVGALKDGHFELASGLHSNQYIEKFDLLRDPVATEVALSHVSARFSRDEVDVVAGPTTGGVILAYEVGRQLGIQVAYAERPADGGAGREFRRGTLFAPGSRVLVVDDILTTGGSIRDTLATLDDYPVEIVAVAVLVDRSNGNTQFEGVPLFALATVDVPTWKREECPLCQERVPITKPGTTKLAND